MIFFCSQSMIDLLVNLCSRLRLSPADHALVIPSEQGDARYPLQYTASQSLHSLGVATVHLVQKKQADRTAATSGGCNATNGRPAADQLPFEVNILFLYNTCIIVLANIVSVQYCSNYSRLLARQTGYIHDHNG